MLWTCWGSCKWKLMINLSTWYRRQEEIVHGNYRWPTQSNSLPCGKVSQLHWGEIKSLKMPLWCISDRPSLLLPHSPGDTCGQQKPPVTGTGGAGNHPDSPKAQCCHYSHLLRASSVLYIKLAELLSYLGQVAPYKSATVSVQTITSRKTLNTLISWAALWITVLKLSSNKRWIFSNEQHDTTQPILFLKGMHATYKCICILNLKSTCFLN